jgi:nicotinate-nucleotide--dimethylbenzimidazole phosphoribosyltransferase
VSDLAAMLGRINAPEPSTVDTPGLGRLGDLARWLAAAQGRWPPAEPVRIRAVLVGAADPALADLADLAGVGVRRLDPAAADLPASQAGQEAVEAVDAEVDQGANLLLVAATGAQVPATALAAVLTHLEPATAVGTGLTDAEWASRVSAVRDLQRALRRQVGDPEALLSTVDSPELAALTGLLLQAAVRRTPVVLDGLAGCAAALVAESVAPAANGWWQLAGRSGSPAEDAALERLGLRALLDLGIDGGPGCSALLAVPLVRAATRLAGQFSAAPSPGQPGPAGVGGAGQDSGAGRDPAA